CRLGEQGVVPMDTESTLRNLSLSRRKLLERGSRLALSFGALSLLAACGDDDDDDDDGAATDPTATPEPDDEPETTEDEGAEEEEPAETSTDEGDDEGEDEGDDEGAVDVPQGGTFSLPVIDNPQMWPIVGGLPNILVNKDRKSTRLNSSHVKISYAVF